MLGLDDGVFLVRYARQSIENYLTGLVIPGPLQRNLSLPEKRGVFVSLLDVSREKELRGCIGAPFPDKPLIAQLSQVAIEAATMDPRFTPVDPSEFRNKIAVEVTVLTSPELVRVGSPLEYEDKVVVGRDGLIVDGMGLKGLLLPQVAVDEGLDSQEFLSQACLKAGLLPDAWLTGRVQVSRFQGQVFSEDKPGGSVQERGLIPKSRTKAPRRRQ